MTSNVTGTRPVRQSIPLLRRETVATLSLHVKYPLDANSGPNESKLRNKIRSAQDTPVMIQSAITISGVEFGLVVLGAQNDTNLTFAGLVTSGNRLLHVEGNLGGTDRHIYIKQTG